MSPQLIQLIHKYDITEALALIATGNYDPYYVNSEDYTALSLACKINITELALALINTGIVNNYTDGDWDDFTPLMHACYNGNFEIVVALLKTGKSNPEFVNSFNHNALWCACVTRNYNIVYVLLTTDFENYEKCLNDSKFCEYIDFSYPGINLDVLSCDLCEILGV